jgi:hypothetical protein
MLTLDQIGQELRAMGQLDTVFLLEEKHTAEAMTAFRKRQERKRELLELAKAQQTKSG